MKDLAEHAKNEWKKTDSDKMWWNVKILRIKINPKISRLVRQASYKGRPLAIMMQLR